MQGSGSGGLGAVSAGISEIFVFALLALVFLFGIWKLVKMIWAAFTG
jgi:hypothetical protein